MTTKKILIISASLLGVCIVVVGLCMAFLTNGTVRTAPQEIWVEKVEDKYFLITSYTSEYKYKFKIEQKLEEDYVLLKTVDTENNVLELSDDVCDFSYGQFRFSACYTTENGAGGKYSSTLEWVPSHQLGQVDYSNLELGEETLSWNEVPKATSYTLNFVAQNGQMQTFDVQTNSFSTSTLAAGSYKVYVVANSDSPYYTSSFAGEGKTFVLQRKNKIISASVAQDVLSLVCFGQAQALEVYFDDQLYVTILLENPVKQGENFVYTVGKISRLLGDVSGKTVGLRTCLTGNFLPSDMFELGK